MALMQTYKRADIAFVSGKNGVLIDLKGKNYIDFGSGIGVNSLGHANKKMVKTISKQAKNLLHTSNLYRILPQEKLSQKISELVGFDGYSFFANSGAEANECAIKLARKYGAQNFSSKKYEIITLKNSFHGRTLATLKATGQDKFHPDIFAPYLDGFVFYENIKEIIENIGENTVAVMIELVQGEGGIYPLDVDEVRELARVLADKKLLLITDEVQCGVYRTGEFVTSKIYGIKPDIISFAKGLGGGVAIGACFSKEDLFCYGDHGSTFGGNFLATQCAIVVLEELSKLKASGKLERIIEIFSKELDKIVADYPQIFKNKTGLGLMQGLVLVNCENQSKIYQLALKNGLLLLTCGTDNLRFLPPLCIKKSEIKEGFKRLRRSLDEVME